MLDERLPEALTFDDVLLVPQKSDVLPSQVDVSTRLTKGISLKVPIVSAAMDTVTDARLAIALAQEGGIGIIHKNMPIAVQAQEILHRHKVEKLLVVDRDFNLKGLITVKDIQKQIKYPHACKDSLGRLRVGAALGVTLDVLDRAAALVEAKVDVVAIDTAHGHTKGVQDAVLAIKKRFPDLEVIAGNVGTFEGAADLVDAGVSAVKVGMGPGSICTTRVVSGAGMPQITAIAEAARASAKADVPVIADGGIKFSGDVVKAIAAGASSVMIGSLFAGTDESPGELILRQGRSFKS